jgi:hypothetical protein
LPERSYRELVAALERVQPFEVPGQ